MGTRGQTLSSAALTTQTGDGAVGALRSALTLTPSVADQSFMLPASACMDDRCMVLLTL